MTTPEMPRGWNPSDVFDQDTGNIYAYYSGDGLDLDMASATALADALRKWAQAQPAPETHESETEQAVAEAMPYGAGFYMECGSYVGEDELAAVAHMERCQACSAAESPDTEIGARP